LSAAYVDVKEGTNCLGLSVDAATSYAWETVSLNLTSCHVYVWMVCLDTQLDTQAAGGFRICLQDNSGNQAAWYVGGGDTGRGIGSWWRFCISADSTPSTFLSGSTLTRSNIVKVGVGFKHLAKSKATVNCCWDFVQYGASSTAGIKVTDGAAAPRDWAELYSKDWAASAGIVQRLGSAYYIQGPVQFGDASSGNITFLDTNKVIFVEDGFLASGHPNITIVGNAAGTTSFTLGSKSGNNGIQGCIFAQNTVTWTNAIHPKLTVTATDTDIGELKLYGSSFIDCGAINLLATASGREALNCTFDSCAEVIPDTFIMTYCNFISSDNRAVRFSSTTPGVTYSNFINCPSGIEITVTGTVQFIGLTFSHGAGQYDIENNTTGSVIASCTFGANPSNYINTLGGTTTIQNNKTLSLTNIQEGSEVRIYSAGTTTELDGVDTISGTSTFNYTYTYVAATYVDIVVHHTDYQYYRIDDYLLLDANSSLPIAQIYDRQYYNPA
jgi:hypothetical protein